MTEESLVWLGVALWLTDLGYTTEQAVTCASPVLSALRKAAADDVTA